jgi:hypothetical protein
MLKRWVCVAASAAALLLVGLTPDVAAAGVPWAEPPRGGGDGDGTNRICIRQEYDPGITLARAAACVGRDRGMPGRQHLAASVKRSRRSGAGRTRREKTDDLRAVRCVRRTRRVRRGDQQDSPGWGGNSRPSRSSAPLSTSSSTGAPAPSVGCGGFVNRTGIPSNPLRERRLTGSDRVPRGAGSCGRKPAATSGLVASRGASSLVGTLAFRAQTRPFNPRVRGSIPRGPTLSSAKTSDLAITRDRFPLKSPSAAGLVRGDAC